MSAIGNFSKELLTRRGALVEAADEEALDIILSPELARELDRPEWLSLSAAARAPDGPSGREWLGFGTDLFRRFGDLLGSRMCEINLPKESFRIEKIRANVRDRIVFNNAVFDDAQPELRRASWLLVWSRHAAISDDRREGLVSFWINETNFSSGPLPVDREEWLRSMIAWSQGLGVFEVAPAGSSASQAMPLASLDLRTPTEVLAAAARVAASYAEESLTDYLEISRRRLERDVRRVCEYYGSLKAEADKRVGERRSVRLQSSGKLSPEDTEKFARKKAAIELECKAKIDDLRSHYALRIEVEPAAIVRVIATAPVFPLLLKRRKESREYPLVYNPLIHRLENPPCEACFRGGASHWICDDRLHILCERCFPTCSACGRRFCRACHAACPKGCKNTLARDTLAWMSNR